MFSVHFHFFSMAFIKCDHKFACAAKLKEKTKNECDGIRDFPAKIHRPNQDIIARISLWTPSVIEGIKVLTLKMKTGFIQEIIAFHY